MPIDTLQSSVHGVMMQVRGQGVLITGAAGIGKSSFALTLLHEGHQLIADDVVDLQLINGQLIAKCPPQIAGMLHSRELGFINIPDLFGQQACTAYHKLDCVIRLTDQPPKRLSANGNQDEIQLLEQTLPRLTLSLANPASLLLRLTTWLSMQHKNLNHNGLLPTQSSVNTKQA